MAFRSANLDHLVKFNSSSAMYFLQTYEDGLDSEITEIGLTKPSQTIAPSSVRCKRKTWFRLRGVEPDKISVPDKALRWSADLGTAIHSIVQEKCINYFEENWIDVNEYLKNFVKDHEYETEVSGYETRINFKDIPIRFSCDGIVRVDNEYYLVEFKTCDSSIFKNLTDVKEEHISQVICYCSLLHLKKALVIYIDRTYGDMKCYERKILPYEESEMIQSFQDVMNAVQTRLAPRGLPKGDKWCTSNYCPYYKKCKEYG